MNILVATKRRYTGKDLLDHQYGRLFEIPEALADQGHRVTGLALSYRGQSEGLHQPRKVAWHAVSAFPFEPLGVLRYLRKFEHLIDAVRPDVVWVSSDAWHAIAAEIVCRRRGVPLVVDLYDNYESFGLTRVPGIASRFRASCRAAAGLTVVGDALREKVVDEYRLGAKPIEVVGNAVDRSVFFPRNKDEARRSLRLPPDVRIIGTAGALDSSRGIEDLFGAFSALAGRHGDLHLAVAGRRDASTTLHAHDRIWDLGVLSSSEMPSFWSALDVAVICNKDSAFGRYCYPQKFQEIVACETPFVAADVGEMARICRNDRSFLYRLGSVDSLADRVGEALSGRMRPASLRASDWRERATVVEALMDRVCSSRRSGSPMSH
ncbi:glycosyltransferase family 4 protein [Variovorax sp. J31P179]|uniref:glycosyltransferase family 4 protein n=1 Tax=Variovorax sp. J31P179 TaxID=3053508 RepID=UPI0025756E94|nr:glycosyltransferase family 4 protein [Variovorax sp. J31P179]MDM0081329.1 glycosyltransferase family 4 protein [Variovorax sp. J31P179]